MSNLQRDVFRRKIQDREDQLRSMGLGSFAEDDEEEQETGDGLGDLGMPPPKSRGHPLSGESDIGEPADSSAAASSLSPKHIHISLGTPSSTLNRLKTPGLSLSSTPRSSKYKPRDWTDYFDEKFTVTVDRNISTKKRIEFTVYFTAPSNAAEMPAFVFHHGAGSSALSFACAAKEIKKAFAAEGAATTGAADGSGVSPGLAGNQVSAAFGGVSPGSGFVPGMGVGSLSAVAPLPVNSKKSAGAGAYPPPMHMPVMIPPVAGMIPLPGSGIPATVFPGSPTAVAQAPNEDTATEPPKQDEKLEMKGETPGVISFDARYHGETKVYNWVESEDGDSQYVEEPFSEMDMSLETLTFDLIDVVNAVYKLKGWKKSSDEEDASPCPSIILVGHSLGGSIVTSAATESAANSKTSSPIGYSPHFTASLSGVCVLDVVEGTAIESLQSMHMILDSRPQTFESVEKGIEWHLRSKALRNLESACVSVPSLLQLQPVFASLNDKTAPISGYSSTVLHNLGGRGGTAVAGGRWEWITNLRTTEPFWKGWFTGLSARFLKVPAARLLVLAGTDRLDKDLMIGQMQGKYQLVVFQEAGHFVQEDVPYKTAHLFYDFFLRNVRSQKIVPVFGSFRKD